WRWTRGSRPSSMKITCLPAVVRYERPGELVGVVLPLAGEACAEDTEPESPQAAAVDRHRHAVLGAIAADEHGVEQIVADVLVDAGDGVGGAVALRLARAAGPVAGISAR